MSALQRPLPLVGLPSFTRLPACLTASKASSLRALLRGSQPSLKPHSKCPSLSASAGAPLQTLAYPFDVVRRRLQVSGWAGAKNLHADHGKAVAYRGMVDCFVRTVREEGMQVGPAGGGDPGLYY